MVISGSTRICAIIGDPVSHSLSPQMHNAAFKKLELDFAYVPFLVKAGELPAAAKGLRALNSAGFNVTIPHKVSVIPLLDGLDPVARQIGAVNTVVNESAKLIGYNTDAEGFLKALEENHVDPTGKKIAVLGAGGASRAITFILASKGAYLTVFNRRENLTRAEELASLVTKQTGLPVRAMALDDLSEGLKGVGLLVNTTSVGMSPESSYTPVPAVLLKGIPLVFDIVYNPRHTRLLKEAKQAGAKTIDGLEMLVWQGAMAFEKWTGRSAPVGVMRREAAKMLRNKNA